ncbi:MAG: transporter substrate-binding domain-containing protein [Deltaproteobacteria bacterium]|nr:transporter substrate-binding domain-containing protein [Deltaproteobacteria bacterium]
MILRAVIICVFSMCVPSFCCQANASPLDSLKLYTEYYPPYNYEEKGELKGIFIDVFERIFTMSESKLTKNDISLDEWSVGYNAALNNDNTIIFACTRTTQRENLFKWVGPIIENRSVLYAKKSRGIVINSLSDIKNKNYKIGVVRDDVGHQLLQNENVSEEFFVVRGFPALNLMDLYRDDIDAWSYSEGVAMWMSAFYGMDSKNFNSVYVINEGQLYIALNKKISQNVVDILQKSLDELKANGELEEIISKYK